MPFWKSKKPTKHTVEQENDRFQRYELHADPASQQPLTASEFSRRGDWYFNEGDYDRSISMYYEALSEHRDNAEVYLQMSLARTLQSPAQLDKALHDVNCAIRIKPSMGRAWKLKGDIYLRIGDFRSAEEALEQAAGMLQGWERIQAQQALADAHSRSAAAPSTLVTSINPTQSPSPASSRVELPVRVHGRHLSAQTQPVQAASVTTPSSAAQMESSSTPSVPLPVRSSSSPSSHTPAVGLTPPAPLPTNRSASPNSAARSDALAQELEMPTDPPPSYTATPRLATGPVNNAASNLMYETQIASLTTSLQTRKQGSLYLKPFTGERQIDSIQLFFHGKTYLQSILLDLPPQPQVHQSWSKAYIETSFNLLTISLEKYHVDTISYPGTTFMDHDCESAASYEGYHQGTVSVLGYAEEYREYQLALKTQIDIHFEAQTIPPVMGVDRIVERLQILQLQPNLEDNNNLGQILGLSSAFYTPNTTTQLSIQNICMMFCRGLHDAPSRFIDFLTTGTLTRHIFNLGGIGLTNFLFLILLGSELLIRLRKVGYGVRYPNIMTKTTSALVYVAEQWMENVSIRKNPPPPGSTATTPGRYKLLALNHARQSEGLIRFAESIAWPYLDEARQTSENLMNDLIANAANVNPYLRDWLYGLSLPGKYFRHAIMSSLAVACPATKHIGPAPYYDSGLVVGDKSYWPKRTVLGRVLGGLRNPKSTCGWIGPLPAPVGIQTGWVLLHTRTVPFATPVLDDLRETNLEILGFSEADASDPVSLVRDVTDMSKWNPPPKLPSRTAAPITTTPGASVVRLEAIRLNQVEVTGAAAVTTKQYRPVVDFTCHDQRISFTLYSNPIFVHVPKCVGATHPIHEKLVKKHMANMIAAKDLKNGSALPLTEGLMIIDATEPGEEAMARAWCAESGKHAVIRKSGIGCFTCATTLGTTRTGLGFGILIWCH